MKTMKVLLIFILVILILPLIGHIAWQLKKSKNLELVVVNKSMIYYKNSENKAFNYILNSKKIFIQGSRPYDLKVDHVGLHWKKGDYEIKYPRLKDIDRLAVKSDLVYYADASGIMLSQVKTLKNDEIDELEYGGLNNTDYIFIRELISNEKCLILECNFFAPPTEALVRYNIEKLTDVYYLGWLGKYVSNLAGDVDKNDLLNWKDLYLEYKGIPLEISGPGIVLINKDARRILVLQEDRDIQTTEGLIISSPEAMDYFGMRTAVNYSGWFTILHPGNNEVLSNFELNATESGMLMLNEAGIPESFPALIRADTHCYYLAGDFGKSNANGFFSKVSMIRPLFDGIKRNSKASSNFFYTYYQPFMNQMLNDALAQRVEDK